MPYQLLNFQPINEFGIPKEAQELNNGHISDQSQFSSVFSLELVNIQQRMEEGRKHHLLQRSPCTVTAATQPIELFQY